MFRLLGVSLAALLLLLQTNKRPRFACRKKLKLRTIGVPSDAATCCGALFFILMVSYHVGLVAASSTPQKMGMFQTHIEAPMQSGVLVAARWFETTAPVRSVQSVSIETVIWCATQRYFAAHCIHGAWPVAALRLLFKGSGAVLLAICSGIEDVIIDMSRAAREIEAHFDQLWLQANARKLTHDGACKLTHDGDSCVDMGPHVIHDIDKLTNLINNSIVIDVGPEPHTPHVPSGRGQRRSDDGANLDDSDDGGRARKLQRVHNQRAQRLVQSPESDQSGTDDTSDDDPPPIRVTYHGSSSMTGAHGQHNDGVATTSGIGSVGATEPAMTVGCLGAGRMNGGGWEHAWRVGGCCGLWIIIGAFAPICGTAGCNS